MKNFSNAFIELFSKENDFFVLAKSGKRITHIAIAIPLLIVIFFAGFIFSELLVFQILLKNPQVPRIFRELYTLIISFGSVILFVWLWVRLFEKRSLFTVGFTKSKALKKYLSGFLTGILMLSGVMLLMVIFGNVQFEVGANVFNFNVFHIIFLFLIGYIVQGASEEILARGWQFQVIGARYKPWLGALISAILFVLLHGLNPGITIFAIVNLLLFAFLMIVLVLRNKSIWAACGWHSAWNWCMETIFGLNVSGTEGSGSLLNLTSKGSEFMSGGEFGPEGSIFSTIVLIVGILVLVLKKSNN